MIIQSPESTMPEPFTTYVRQRSRAIAEVLEDVVHDDDVQLCPRAVTPDEVLVKEGKGHVYGAVVSREEDGLKSVLYEHPLYSIGKATDYEEDAVNYAKRQLAKGNRVRVKDARESDGQGQHTVDSIDQLLEAFAAATNGGERACVLMPHLDKITRRASIGRISLNGIGDYTYFGLERVTRRDGEVVYGGTELGLFNTETNPHKSALEVCRKLETPFKIYAAGYETLERYAKVAISCGRVSVDVIEGTTDNGEVIRDVVDITPRVGGATPAEALAIREMDKHQATLCYASSRLIYDPESTPTAGVNFIDTDSLIINAAVSEVIIR